MLKNLFALLTIISVTGCASQSHVIVGTVRTPIAVEQVKIYLSPPKKFEQVAILDASSRGSFAFTDQQKMDTAILGLKSQAAKIGANGILLQSAGDQSAGAVATGFGSSTTAGHNAFGTGFGVATNVFIKSATGTAIYVTEE
jgi:hypothetical protein